MAPPSPCSRIEAPNDAGERLKDVMRGRPAAITFAEQPEESRIRKLYDADRAGVDIRPTVRGICCCLVTEVKGMSDRIRAPSASWMGH
ncbi:MAG: hypothetical protein H6597_03130 [Flavobacteriales bacterium]|nr:hypothetical protein [Flavobacteriales bacterium]